MVRSFHSGLPFLWKLRIRVPLARPAARALPIAVLAGLGSRLAPGLAWRKRQFRPSTLSAMTHLDRHAIQPQ